MQLDIRVVSEQGYFFSLLFENSFLKISNIYVNAIEECGPLVEAPDIGFLEHLPEALWGQRIRWLGKGNVAQYL